MATLLLQLLFSKELTTFIVGTTKDIFQILFFIIAGTVTVLTYLHAKRTLFTPIKTEVFKLQIKAYEDILAFFQNKSETDFTNLFDLDFILKSNARLMFNEFVSHFYKNEIAIDKERAKKLLDGFKGAVATQSWAEKNFISPEYFENDEVKEQETITNPAIILEHWKKYEFGPIHFTKKYHEETEKLNLLIASPLIPIDLKLELEKFEENIKENLFLVGTILNEIAQELPYKFPTANSLKKFDPVGVWNKYNHKSQKLEPISTAILLRIRKYLNIDKIIE